MEQGKLVEELKSHDANPNYQKIWQLAGLLRRVLLNRMVNLPQDLPLPLGTVSLFGNQEPQQVVGIWPLGWRGQRKKYPYQDDMNQPITLGSLVLENRDCSGTIAEEIALPVEDITPALANEPHIEIVRNPGGFRDHELRDITPIIEAVRPESVTLGDPVIYLQPERGAKNLFKIPVFRPALHTRADMESAMSEEVRLVA